MKFKVVDADSGRPIPGLSFWSTADMEMALARSLERVLSQPHVAESPPVTNENGEFTAVFKPGKLRFGFHQNELLAGYAAVSNDDQTLGREVVLPAGKKIEVEFKLRKVVGADSDKRKVTKELRGNKCSRSGWHGHCFEWPCDLESTPTQSRGRATHS